MQIKGIRVYVVLVAIAVTVGVLLTIQVANQKYNVEQPLFKLYSQTKLVKDVKLEEKGNVVQVVVAVKKTDNLKQAYKQLNADTEKIMGNNAFNIQLKDNRNTELDQVYNKSQFIIYEALIKGDFTEMADQIQENAVHSGAEAQLFIDDDNIYVSLIKGSHYLYEIVPRQPKTSGKVPEMMGSEQT